MTKLDQFALGAMMTTLALLAFLAVNPAPLFQAMDRMMAPGIHSAPIQHSNWIAKEDRQ